MAHKKRKRRKKTKAERFLLFILEIILLALMAAGLFISYKLYTLKSREYKPVAESAVSIRINNDISADETERMKGFISFPVLGTDRQEEQQEVETVLVCSIDEDSRLAAMTVVYTDTVFLNADGIPKTCSEAYAEDGIHEVVNLLNRNLDLKMEDYFVTDIQVLAEAVDLVGGIPMILSETDMMRMNETLDDYRGYDRKDESILFPGEQILDGVQALAYCKASDMGNDADSAQRQGEIVEQIFRSVDRNDFLRINKLTDTLLKGTVTTFSIPEILKLAAWLPELTVSYGDFFPMNGREGDYYGYTGFYALDYLEEIKNLHWKMFGSAEYEPSDTVQYIDMVHDNAS